MKDGYWRMVVVASQDGVMTLSRVARTGEEPDVQRYRAKGSAPEGTRFNVLQPHVNAFGDLEDCFFVYEPDYLVDVTAVARCFGSYADDSVVSLLSRFEPSDDSPAILLGSFASQLLDEAIYDRGNSSSDYRDSVQRFFRSNALPLATCSDFSRQWHDEARRQQINLRNMMSSVNRDKALVEPSFVCEALGLQGRIDLLQSDGLLLVEQKSGKWSMDQGHRIAHYVQMLLYLAVLKYNFHIESSQVAAYLLYSKYPDGLLREAESPSLLKRALRIRNDIVRDELNMTDYEGVRQQLGGLRVEELNSKGCHPHLWEPYIRPKLQAIIQPIQNADELSLSYFYRFFAFLEREQVLQKVGPSVLNRRRPDARWLRTYPGKEFGLSGMWNLSPDEKRRSGDLLDGLTIQRLTKNERGDVEVVTLLRPQGESDVFPNFRVGDTVALFHYPNNGVPDVRRTIEHRATLVEITRAFVSVRLRSPQRNEKVFAISRSTSKHWALEHDFMGASFGALYRGLHALLLADSQRRLLLLGKRPPRVDRQLRLSSDYGAFNPLVLKAKQARDFFLLVGPPGTGKTSFGLINILKEELLSDSSNAVLLLSYTNRAVDEICSKLLKEDIDFIRIGNGWTTDEAYLDHLLNRRMKDKDNVSAIREELMRVRVFVSTVASLNVNQRIFRLRSFSLAIVDEASQILEPYLISLLSARCQSPGSSSQPNAIGRFVLIGDEKQLPAVVLQPRDESVVREKLLIERGIRDCRESLFGRLLRNCRDQLDVVHVFSRQGRMHPDVADFANRTFYGATLLPVGLPHQVEALSLSPADDADELERMVATHRTLFLPCVPAFRNDDSDAFQNQNLDEARLAARLAGVIFRLYVKGGIPFDVRQSLGIIVPYRSQITAVRRQIERLSGGVNYAPLLSVTIDTVERFQGSERDVIIYSTTVQHPEQLDFLTESTFTDDDGVSVDRKLNVALTRARKQLFVIGNPEVLRHNPIYDLLISQWESYSSDSSSSDSF